MATIKDTVASHISTNWNGAVVCGSTAIPTIDAVGPEDIENPREYDEAVLVYNERKIVKKRFNQNLYENRVYAVPVTIRLTEEAANTKTIMDNCRTELERIFGVQVSGFDPGQYFDGPNNLTMGKGLYEARYTLFLPQYGVSVSAAWTAVGTTTGYQHVIPVTDGTYDLGTTLLRWRYLYADTLELTNPLADSEVADDITLTNITQITTRKMDDLQAPDATVDCGGQKLDNVASLQNDAAILLMPNDDTDDYLEVHTTSNKPTIKAIGGLYTYFESDNATYAGIVIQESATNYIAYVYHKSGNYAYIYSPQRLYIRSYSSVIDIQPNNDNSDNFYFETTANVPSIKTNAGAKVALIGEAAASLDNIWSDDFTNTSPYKKLNKPLDKLKGIKDKKDKDNKDVIDYASIPEWIRTVNRDYTKQKYKEVDDDPDPITGKPRKKTVCIERAPKDVVADDAWSINRMVLLLVQAVQELTAKVEALEAKP